MIIGFRLVSVSFSSDISLLHTVQNEALITLKNSWRTGEIGMNLSMSHGTC